MKALIAICLILAAPAAEAACFADYKAKQDKPLRLHYGVMEVEADPCQKDERLTAAVAGRLDRAGWVLLQVLSAFGDEGLDDRKADAGEFYLRY